MGAPVHAAALSEPSLGTGERSACHPTFAQLYEEHFSFAWRTARRLGAPEANLDDVVQENLHGRLSKASELRGEIVNQDLGVRNRPQCRARPSTDASGEAPTRLWPGVGTDPDGLSNGLGSECERLTQAEAVRLVDRWLEALDDDKREVFVLAELEQMSAPEIARALGIPVNTVYSRLRLARQEFASVAARHRARDEWRTR